MALVDRNIPTLEGAEAARFLALAENASKKRFSKKRQKELLEKLQLVRELYKNIK